MLVYGGYRIVGSNEGTYGFFSIGEGSYYAELNINIYSYNLTNGQWSVIVPDDLYYPAGRYHHSSVCFIDQIMN